MKLKIKQLFRKLYQFRIPILLFMFIYVYMSVLLSSPWYTGEEEASFTGAVALESFSWSIVLASLIISAIGIYGTKFMLQEERARSSGAAWFLSLDWVRGSRKHFLFSFKNLGVKDVLSVRFSIYGDGVSDTVSAFEVRGSAADSKAVESSDVLVVESAVYESVDGESVFMVPVSVASSSVMVLVEWEDAKKDSISYHALYRFDVVRSKFWSCSARRFVGQLVN